MYENWDRYSLIRKIFNLEDQIEQLKKQLSKANEINDHLSYRIKTELEPRIRNEHRAYDEWVTNPERG